MKIIKITESTTYDQLMKIILSGCKFKYYSYDHKKALEEYKKSEEYSQIINNQYSFSTIYGENQKVKIDSYNMPDHLKEKYKTERIGKLRQIEFTPHGQAWRFKIGAKYAKTYYIEDFGKTVFPLKKTSK